MNPSDVSRQMGHISAKMLFDTYTKWIDKADRGARKQKWKLYYAPIRLVKPSIFSQIFPISEAGTSKPLNTNEKFGRHDWTRTNDPYHVKVVL